MAGSVGRLVAVATLLAGAFEPASAQPSCWYEHIPTRLVRFDDALRAAGIALEPRLDDSDRRDRPERGDPRRGANVGQRLEVTWVDDVAPHGVSPGDTIVVVRWTPGPDCTLVPDTRPFDVGSEQVVEGRPRPTDERIADRPTLDLTPEHIRAIPGETGFVYRRFLQVLPTEAEWNGDCRELFPRMEAWIAENDEWAGYPPFNNLRFLREGCDEVLARAIEGRLRSPQTRSGDLTARLLGWHGEVCAGRPPAAVPGRRPIAVPGRRPIAVPGRFTATEAEQAVVLCPAGDAWRLVVVTLGDSIEETELMRMPGQAEEWSLSVGPTDYFAWMEAVEHRFDEEPLEPEFEIVLLDEKDRVEDDVIGRVAPTIAFFRMGDGWATATPRCCYWGQQELPQRAPE